MSSAAATLREARFTGAVTARQQLISLKGGNLFLRESQVTDEVAPGGVVDARAVVSNGANLILATDRDECGNNANPCSRGFLDRHGYCYELEVTPSWSRGDTTGPTCIKTTEIGTTDQVQSFAFEAPREAGEHTIRIRLEALGSGEFGSITERVLVTETAPERPGAGNGDDADNGDEGPVERAEGLLTILAVLAGLALVGGIAGGD